MEAFNPPSLTCVDTVLSLSLTLKIPVSRSGKPTGDGKAELWSWDAIFKHGVVTDGCISTSEGERYGPVD